MMIAEIMILIIVNIIDIVIFIDKYSDKCQLIAETAKE